MNTRPQHEPGKSLSFRQFLKLASNSFESLRNVFSLCLRLSLISCCGAAGAASAGTHRLNSDEMKMFALVADHSGQNRPNVSLDPILCKVARERAADMDKKNYFAHVNRSGQGPNFLVRKAGYTLPYYYDGSKSGNSIESIAKTLGTPRETFALWMDSPPHETHILGKLSFYSDQTSVGVGVYRSKSAPYYVYSVFISAPANAAKKPPSLALMDSKGRIIALTRLTASALSLPVLTGISE